MIPPIPLTLIMQLRMNAKENIHQLSNTTTLAPQTIYYHLQRIQRYLTRFTILPDYSQLGFKVRGLVVCTLTSPLVSSLKNCPWIQSLATTETQVLAEFILTSNASFNALLEKIIFEYNSNVHACYQFTAEYKVEDFLTSLPTQPPKNYSR